MEVILSCICIIIASMALIMMIMMNHIQKYKILEVRVEEALKNIEFFLDKKEQNLKNAIPIIIESNKKKYNKKDVLQELIKNKNKKRSFQEKDENLRKNLKEFKELLEDDPKLMKIKELNEIYYSSIEIENDLNASKKYYNKIVKKIDTEFSNFPKNIIKKIVKYEPLEKFNTKKEETLEILKEKAETK